MRGKALSIHTRYGSAIAIMQEMSWSWSEFLEAPYDLIEEIWIRLQARTHWQNEKDSFERRMAQARQEKSR